MITKIQIVVKPNARHTSVEKLSSGEYRVAVNAPAKEGRGNAAVIDALADFFKIPKSKIQIVAGDRSKKKRVEIELPIVNP